ncbi:MAG: penicillin-binding protein activator, partial [Caulobacterales bacterium]
ATQNVGVDVPGAPGSTRAGVRGDRMVSVQSMRDSKGLLPPHMEGRKVVRAAVILPFSHNSAQVRDQSEGLLHGAELALFEQAGDEVMLLPKDAGSTPQSAQEATQLALKDGADIILGPLLSATVPAASQTARSKNVPLIAFTNDRSVAQSGSYILSFTAEQEVDRIVGFAAKKGYKNFALLAPDTELGLRMDTAFRTAVARAGGTVTVSQRYPRDPSALSAPIASAAAALRRTAGKQAVLIPEKGNVLRAIAPLLIINKVDMTRTKVLGTSAWGEEDVSREPALKGGWYAAADPVAHAAFEARYEKAFGKKPPKLASLAYDATALASALGANGPQGISRSGIENSDGFMGADGLFRFKADGTAERGLAILEISPGDAKIVDASPRRFPEPGA